MDGWMGWMNIMNGAMQTAMVVGEAVKTDVRQWRQETTTSRGCFCQNRKLYPIPPAVYRLNDRASEREQEFDHTAE